MRIINAPRGVQPLFAIREMSRSAHRWRDRAAAYYDQRRYKLASRAKKEKEHCYALKERGIVAMHQAEILRYAGASPQGMAVYEYDLGGKACFHSCLHPVGVERVTLIDHPEILLVPAKGQQVRICDAEFTLNRLPAPGPGYERCAPPRIARPKVTCYECGAEGHIARNCPERFEDYFDEFYHRV